MINFDKYDEQLTHIVNHLNVCTTTLQTNRNEETEEQFSKAAFNFDIFIKQYATDCLSTFGVNQDHPKHELIISLAQDYCVVFKESYLRNLYCCLRDLAQLV